MLPRDSAEVRPETLLKARRDERAPFFRAEHTMVARTDVGHMHAFSRPFGTCAIVKSPYPTLKGWATLESSLRDEDQNPGGIVWGQALQPGKAGNLTRNTAWLSANDPCRHNLVDRPSRRRT